MKWGCLKDLSSRLTFLRDLLKLSERVSSKVGLVYLELARIDQVYSLESQAKCVIMLVGIVAVSGGT